MNFDHKTPKKNTVFWNLELFLYELNENQRIVYRNIIVAVGEVFIFELAGISSNGCFTTEKARFTRKHDDFWCKSERLSLL